MQFKNISGQTLNVPSVTGTIVVLADGVVCTARSQAADQVQAGLLEEIPLKAPAKAKKSSISKPTEAS